MKKKRDAWVLKLLFVLAAIFTGLLIISAGMDEGTALAVVITLGLGLVWRIAQVV